MTAAAWRRLPASGERVPAWLAAYRSKSGVYAIRSHGRVVYVGESHKGRLLKTMLRHFQHWRRGKGFWSSFFGSPADPGHTYDRAACEVRLESCAASAAIDLQNRWIRRLRPRDNQIGAEEDKVPF